MIKTDYISKLHDAFKFLHLKYYRNLKRITENYLISQEDFDSILDIQYTQKIEIEIQEADLLQMQILDNAYTNELLRTSKDEILSNIYSIQENDRLHYLESYKTDFYSICKSTELSTILLNLRIGQKNYVQLGKEERTIIDNYIDSISFLAYRWSYELYLIEKSIRNYSPINEVIIPPRDIRLREDLVFKILYIYDYDDIVDEMKKTTQKNNNDQYLEELEKLLKDKTWIRFSDGALKKYLNGNFNPKTDGLLEWLYVGKKKSEKTPSILHLAIFSLFFFKKYAPETFKNDRERAKYISESIGRKEVFDHSTISIAGKVIRENKIENFRELIEHLEH